MSSANRRFYFHFFILDIFISFSCITALARISSTMWNKSGKSGHHCLMSDFKEKPSVFAFEHGGSCVLVVDSLRCADLHSFHTSFAESFLYHGFVKFLLQLLR